MEVSANQVVAVTDTRMSESLSETHSLPSSGDETDSVFNDTMEINLNIQDYYNDDMSNLRTLSGCLYSKLRKAQRKKEEVLDFEDSFSTCKALIRESSLDLVRKIQEHEQRLLEELEAQKEVEYRKLGINRDKLIDEVNKMQKIYDESTNLLEHPKLTKFDMWKDIMNELSSNCSKNHSWLDNEVQFHCVTFQPIRCNTAFGCLESNGTINNLANSRKRTSSSSIAPTLLSPTARNKQRTRAISVCYPNHNHVYRSQSFLNEKVPESTLQVSVPKYTPLKQSKSVPRKISNESCASSKSDETSEGSSISDETGDIERLLWQIDQEGTNPGEISCPTDVAFLPDAVVVAENGVDRLQLFSMDQERHHVIGVGQIKPRRVAVTREGNIAVTDSKDLCIKVFTPEGHLLTSWGKKRFKNIFKSPCGIAVNSVGQFIISDSEKHTVSIYTSEGKLIRPLGSKGMGAIQFQSPSYITVNKRDQLIVSDNWTHCIKVFDSTGNFLYDFNSLHEGEGHLKYPNGVCVEPSGDVVVADWGNHTVSKFSAGGMFLGHLLTRADSIYHPAGLAADSNGHLAVTEYSDTHSSLRLYKLNA